MAKKNDLSRRQFLKNTATISVGALVFPSLIPASAIGKNGSVAPSNRVVLGCIGMGDKVLKICVNKLLVFY